MNDDLWQRARTLFDAAADLPPDARLAYLDATCADEPALRDEVLGLLGADEGEDAPQFNAVARIAASVGHETDLEANQTIGPYRVDRELAHGGMGTVFLAHRADDEFQRQVAIKVIRGYPDEDMVRRFRVERQILANLDHIHIARLIDGGATSAGLPYLVMEYVAGQPIGVYCDAQHLPVRDRVQLISTLCRAVHYAHERGIVHRDLKPSLTYRWTQGATVLANTASFSATFGLGVYNLAFEVTDAQGQVATATTQLTVSLPASGGLPGPQGIQGEKGDTGATGQQGIQGLPGIQGDKGEKGDKGDQGDMGSQGAQGVPGLTGPPGLQGDTGAVGQPGIQGVKGDTGATGQQGIQGPSGATGPQGPLGLGLSFIIRRIPSESPILALPAGTSSVVYLVTTGPSNVTIQLPPATAGQSRMITIRRVDNSKKVFVQAQPSESIDGAASPIELKNSGDYLTLVSDGTAWAVIAQQR